MKIARWLHKQTNSFTVEYLKQSRNLSPKIESYIFKRLHNGTYGSFFIQTKGEYPTHLMTYRFGNRYNDTV